MGGEVTKGDCKRDKDLILCQETRHIKSGNNDFFYRAHAWWHSIDNQGDPDCLSNGQMR